MDHNFVFNTLCLPAKTTDDAFRFLLDTMKGMLAVGADNDRHVVYSDHQPDLNSCIVAPNYTYGNFVSQLETIGEQDLQLALMEIDDKTPMLDFITEEQFVDIAAVAYYFPDEPYSTSIDILAMAWHLDATLLSIGTAAKWCVSEIEFAEYAQNSPLTGSSYLRNISCEEQGMAFWRQYVRDINKPFDEAFLTCRFSDDFMKWIKELSDDLQVRIRDKLTLAEAKKFQGGKPLFDTLTDADGLREMRFSAVQGGAVRILFGPLSFDKQAILVGFVKKSNSEGYPHAIKSALSLFAQMKSD